MQVCEQDVRAGHPHGGHPVNSSFTLSKSDGRQILKHGDAIKRGRLRVDKFGELRKINVELKRLEAMRMRPYRLGQL